VAQTAVESKVAEVKAEASAKANAVIEKASTKIASVTATTGKANDDKKVNGKAIAIAIACASAIALAFAMKGKKVDAKATTTTTPATKKK